MYDLSAKLSPERTYVVLWGRRQRASSFEIIVLIETLLK
jgi:hypothetical protein